MDFAKKLPRSIRPFAQKTGDQAKKFGMKYVDNKIKTAVMPYGFEVKRIEK